MWKGLRRDLCKDLGLQFHINLPKGNYKRWMRVLYIHCILNSWSTKCPSSFRSWKEVLPCRRDAETRVSSIGSAGYIWNLNLNVCGMHTLFVVFPIPCHLLVLGSSVLFETRVTGMQERAFLLGRPNKAIHLASRQSNAWGSNLQSNALQSNEGTEAHRINPASGRWTLADTALQQPGKENRKKTTKEN